MTRKSTKSDGALLVILMIIGLPIYGLSKIYESVGWIPIISVFGTIIVLFFGNKYYKRKRKLSYLREKYQNEELAQKIFNNYFWEGQSADQLRDSLGLPVAIDNKLLKTKTKEIWKYNHQGGNRYSLRITVENGYVVGWDNKA